MGKSSNKCHWSINGEVLDREGPGIGKREARENKIKTLVIGGVEDHVHLLMSIPPTLSVAKTVQLLKGNSSKWVHETFQEHRDFEWQEGYGAFSIGISGIEDTTQYIAGQAGHHRRMTFKEEVEAFLKKHGMEYVTQDLE